MRRGDSHDPRNYQQNSDRGTRSDKERLDERQLILWAVNMFADCSEDEFVSGILELCEIYTEAFPTIVDKAP